MTTCNVPNNVVSRQPFGEFDLFYITGVQCLRLLALTQVASLMKQIDWPLFKGTRKKCTYIEKTISAAYFTVKCMSCVILLLT